MLRPMCHGTQNTLFGAASLAQRNNTDSTLHTHTHTYTHKHTRTHAYARTRARAHTHTKIHTRQQHTHRDKYCTKLKLEHDISASPANAARARTHWGTMYMHTHKHMLKDTYRRIQSHTRTHTHVRTHTSNHTSHTSTANCARERMLATYWKSIFCVTTIAIPPPSCVCARVSTSLAWQHSSARALSHTCARTHTCARANTYPSLLSLPLSELHLPARSMGTLAMPATWFMV